MKVKKIIKLYYKKILPQNKNFLAQFLHISKWKKFVLVLFVFFLLLSSALINKNFKVKGTERKNLKALEEIPDEYKSVVLNLKKEGVLKGYLDGNLYLDKDISKGEFIVLLIRTLKTKKERVYISSKEEDNEKNLFWIRYYGTLKEKTKNFKDFLSYIKDRIFTVRIRIFNKGNAFFVNEKHWLFPHLKEAYLKGIINLDFNPFDKVSCEQFFTLGVKALGFGFEILNLQSFMDDSPQDAIKIILAQHGLLDAFKARSDFVKRKDVFLFLNQVLKLQEP